MIIIKDALEITLRKSGEALIEVNKYFPRTVSRGYWNRFSLDSTNAIYTPMVQFYRQMKATSYKDTHIVKLLQTDNKKLLPATHYFPTIRNWFVSNHIKMEDWFPGKMGDTTATTETIPETDTPIESEPEVVKTPKEICIDELNHLMNFFSEFKFEPSFRFVNTFTHILKEQTVDKAIDYVRNYFSLLDSPYRNEIIEKMKCAEFTQLAKNLRDNSEPTQYINQRFKVYYGSAGTGKTTLAQEEAENRCVVCNSSMLPADLMEDFCFEDGHPSFKPSLLWECMTKGQKIVLDEINLLPFDSLRFLQGIVDGKKQFYYKNRLITIADGFQIIGTMNLTLNGMVYGLPEPLVDRCCDMKEFKLTAEQLYNAVA